MSWCYVSVVPLIDWCSYFICNINHILLIILKILLVFNTETLQVFLEIIKNTIPLPVWLIRKPQSFEMAANVPALSLQLYSFSNLSWSSFYLLLFPSQCFLQNQSKQQLHSSCNDTLFYGHGLLGVHALFSWEIGSTAKDNGRICRKHTCYTAKVSNLKKISSS